jgi:hypothetical protein
MQAQMIYPQSNVAAMIAGRLSKSKGFAYGVTKVLTGFLVAPTAKVPTLAAAVDAFQAELLYPKVEKTWTGEDTYTAHLPFKSEGKEWLCARKDGKAFWVPKSALVSWEVNGIAPAILTFRMPVKYAQKRGLIAK